jgi:hypothetical protein
MGIWFNLAQFARLIFWLLLIGLILVAVAGRFDNSQQLKRDALVEQFQVERKSRVIALIHRQESNSVLGLQVSTSIGIEDSEAILRAIRLTPDEQPIDLILHTPGGLVLAAEQIAMAAQEIVMDRNAVLGPVDPQIGGVAASSILQVVQIKKDRASDETLIMADMAAKARVQVASFVADLLSRRMERKQAEALAVVMSEGRWTHDFPINVASAKQLGFPVTTNMPRVVYDLMDLYPQPAGARPSVLYVPVRNPGSGTRPPADELGPPQPAAPPQAPRK